eukprot:gene37120-48490_t
MISIVILLGLCITSNGYSPSSGPSAKPPPNSISAVNISSYVSTSKPPPSSVPELNPTFFSTSTKLSTTLRSSILHDSVAVLESPPTTVPTTAPSPCALTLDAPVADSAYRSNKDLTSVCLTSNVITIGNNAFVTSSLTSIFISTGVTYIGSFAFYDSNLLS